MEGSADAPADDALFVRFGQGQPHVLADQAWTYASGRGGGVWGLSVWYWPGLTPDQIVWRAYETAAVRGAGNPFRQRIYRTWSRRALQEFDFLIEVQKTYGPGHYTVVLPSFILEQDYDPTYHRDRSRFPAYDHNAAYFDEFAALLGPPIENPVRSL